MNEHFFQAGAKKLLGLVGYISGLVGIVSGIYLAIKHSDAWLDYIPLIASGFIVFYLADLMQSSHNRMEMLLRIIKRQEALLRQVLVNGAKQNQPPPIPPGQMKNFKFISPEDLVKTFNELGSEIQKALDEQEIKSFDDLSVDELKKMRDEALEEEDYDKAAFLRDIIDKREEEGNQ